MSNLPPNPHTTHPFINDLSEKSIEELLEAINGIDSKIFFAMRMGNRNLANQLNMAKNSYQSQYQTKMTEQFEKMNLKSGVNITKKS